MTSQLAETRYHASGDFFGCADLYRVTRIYPLWLSSRKVIFLFFALLLLSTVQCFGQGCSGVLKGETLQPKVHRDDPDVWVPYPDYQASPDDIATRINLQSQGISVNKCACPDGVSFKLFKFLNSSQPGCTTVAGLQSYTMGGLTLLRQLLGQPIVVTGGNESGHSAGEGHGAGNKVDLRIDSGPYFNGTGDFDNLSKFIVRGLGGHFRNVGVRGGDGALLYGSGGVVFALETYLNPNYTVASGPHWDIRFFPSYSAQLTTTTQGQGAGQVFSTLSGPPCSTVSFDCRVVFSGTIVDLVAQPDGQSIFAGWTGPVSGNGSSTDVEVDVDSQVTADFEQQPPPPDQSGCWAWEANIGVGYGGFRWTCMGDPPQPVRQPQDVPGLCWQAAQNARGVIVGWFLVKCGGGCVLRSQNVRSPQLQSLASGSNIDLTDCRPARDRVEIITSGDPNEKTGSLGTGALQYVAARIPIRYGIFFANEPPANAPAYFVGISDTIDKAKIDLNTLALGPITFVDRVIKPPSTPLALLGSYSTDVDLRPTQNLIVRITASLDVNTGLLSVTYDSLDPSSEKRTTDPERGFLPVNNGGSVFFTAMPTSALSTDTRVENQASIVFDVHEPISTPVWFNTIDMTSPISHIIALPAKEATANFVVQWQGSDVGAGVQDHSIYFSDNGSSFAPWLTDTTAPQAIFQGVAGHSYRFYSIARDLVGNREGAKSTAEATTVVDAEGLAGDVNGDGVIDCSDIALIKASFGRKSGDVGYNSQADVNSDGIIDVRDLALVSQQLAPGTKCR